MPSLNPGKRAKTPPCERLRITLGGADAGSAVVQLQDEVGLVARAKGGSVAGPDIVVEASGTGEATVRLVSARRNAPIGGRVTLRVTSTPMHEATQVGSKRSWDVVGLEPEGRTAMEVLRITKEDSDEWTLESLVEATTGPDTQDGAGLQPSRAPAPAVSRARIAWGDRERVTRDVVLAVDRSASMAWAYQPGGVLEDLYEGVVAAGASALDPSSTISWYSYGSGAENKSQRVRRAEGVDAESLVTGLRPDLFSSGARIDLGILEQLNLLDVVAVTDCLTRTPELIEGHTRGLLSAVIVVGATADEDLLPDEDRTARAELQGAGIPVLLLPADVPSGVHEREQHVDDVARFLLTQFEAGAVHGKERGHASNE
ncbi:MAG: hypothetical protein QG597_5149 [Actinomycetota bacterium]|nr:hypothetical protein [Actinomycetota bacterium]